jgi:hypothetical protein
MYRRYRYFGHASDIGVLFKAFASVRECLSCRKISEIWIGALFDAYRLHE